MLKGAREGTAVNDEACTYRGSKGDEEHNIEDEDDFADGLEPGELIRLGIDERCNAASRHCACKPGEREASHC